MRRNEYLIWLAGVGGVIIFVLWAFSGLAIYKLANPSERGIWGDMFGAVNALFSGWAFLGVIIAIILQYEELSAQREEIHFARVAQEESARALAQQLKTAQFTSRLESYNLLIQAQQRVLARLESPRTVDDKERQREAEKLLAYYEGELAKLIQLEAMHAGSSYGSNTAT